MLKGARILVTRPARQAQGFADRLVAIGGVPVIIPALAILPPADGAALARVHRKLADYDGAFFVSANAVEFGIPAVEHWPETLAAFAPGPGTAAVLRTLGIAKVSVPEKDFDSEGLLALPELAAPAGKRFIVFRGEGGRELLGDTLVARGATVEYVACYRRAAPDAAAARLSAAFAAAGIDAVTITSSEGLDHLWTAATDTVREAWRVCPTFVPHSRIAARAGGLGLQVVATAGGDTGLLDGLLEWFAVHPPRSS